MKSLRLGFLFALWLPVGAWAQFGGSFGDVPVDITVDQANGAVRVHPLPERLLADSQYSKEICNLMHLRQLGCSTGTLQDYGPDFGLTYVLDGLAAMGQK